MNQFVNTISEQTTTTTNGMPARITTADACVDLFFKIGASRGKNITPQFVAALVEDKELALRIALHARDVREGGGERETFRNILRYLENTDIQATFSLMKRVPELGRWDDLFAVNSQSAKEFAFSMMKEALENGDALCAKWMPREKSTKKKLATELRSYMGLTPKQYRKLLVNATEVVETAMCSKNWDNIDFSSVPSVASARYKKAFGKNASEKYTLYTEQLKKNLEDPENADKSVKVNASAIFPHDVLKGVFGSYGNPKGYSETESNLIDSQWASLPNHIGNKKVLPLVDVSGSMGTQIGPKGNTTAIDVSVSLGLYCSDKNGSAFKDTFLTFSREPELITLKGKITEKCAQMVSSSWNTNTNLSAAYDKILSHAVSNNVPQEDMPDTLLILSDMQFDYCVTGEDAFGSMKTKYNNAGYKIPNVVFWNLISHDNVPVRFNENGTALVSGYSPTILKAIMEGDMEDFTPQSIMMKTIMKPRYNI